MAFLMAESQLHINLRSQFLRVHFHIKNNLLKTVFSFKSLQILSEYFIYN